MRNKGFAVLTIAAMAIAGLAPVTGFGASRVEVEIEDYAFVPQTVIISVGDTVEWKNRDDVGHTSTSGEPGNPDGMWDSGLLARDEAFSYVFTQEGNYPYFCTPHTWMTGEVVVEPTDTTGDTTEVPAVEESTSFSTLGLELSPGTVEFSLPRTGSVTLAVYDILGNQVAVLTRGLYPGGSYEIPLTPLDSGIYFVRLTASQGKITRKLVQIS